MESIEIVNARGPKLFSGNYKRPGLAVLVGVGCCHEMGVGEGLVKRLTLEATLGAILLLYLQLFDPFSEPVSIPV